MSANPLKNCIAYRIAAPFVRALVDVANNPVDPFHDTLHERQPIDPSGGAWRTSGIAPAHLAGNEPVVPVTDGLVMMAVQFNERILPGKVRDEHLAKLVEDIKNREGRPVGRKEYAELREQVEFDLLPKAFIRRSWVYVSFIESHDLMLVHTSSAKRSDDVIAALRGLFVDFPVEFAPELLRPKTPVATLTRLATDGYQEDSAFEPTDTAVLRGENKEVVRIKDLDIGSQDVVALLDQNYLVTELGLHTFDDAADDAMRFVVNDKFVFKRIEVPGVKLTGHADPEAAIAEFHAHVVMLMSYLANAVTQMLEDMGGHVPLDNDKDEQPEQPDQLDDEDEL